MAKNDDKNQVKTDKTDNTDFGKVGGVEDAEARFENETTAEDKKEAKQREKVLESVADDPVKVRTPEEIKKNQESADNDGRKAAVDLTNRGLRNDTRPGGGDGNGKTYKDERIQPSDTNAPDAGLLPDGTRVAQ